MADDVIERRARRIAVTAVVQCRRQGTVILPELIDELIYGSRCHAWFYNTGNFVEALSRQLRRSAHAIKIFGRVELYLAGIFQGRIRRFKISDQ